MERLLALWVPDLTSGPRATATLDASATLLDELLVLCPFSEMVRRDFFVLPVRGPSRFMGGDDAVLDAVRATLFDVTGLGGHLGIAEGLFCAELAARQGLVVAAGETERFRRRQPLEVLGRRDLVTVGRRLGIHTLGGFADLPRARVAERFNKHAVLLHRVAAGEVAELDGQRDRTLAKQLRQWRGEAEPHDEQLGFFGQRGAAEERAERAAQRVRRRLGPEGVMLAALRGGRSPEDRTALVPWGATLDNDPEAPWPGRHEAPAPVSTLRHPVSVTLSDGAGRPVSVGARGNLSDVPMSIAFLSQQRRAVQWHAGPWPLVERWWAQPRRRAHLQVLLDSGQALLLMFESGQWWLVGIYD